MSDFDNPWKDVLEHFFRHFLEFFFPDAHAAIDWSRDYQSLDKELQQIVSESELGLRLAAKLFVDQEPVRPRTGWRASPIDVQVP